MIRKRLCCSSLKWEAWDLNLGTVKSYTVLPTARHRCDITSKGAAFPGATTRRWAPQTPLHAFGLVERENERIDFASQRDKRLINYYCFLNELTIQSFNDGVWKQLNDCVWKQPLTFVGYVKQTKWWKNKHQFKAVVSQSFSNRGPFSFWKIFHGTILKVLLNCNFPLSWAVA